MSENQWVPSRFNAISYTDDGEVILYNSYTGAIATFTKEENVLSALRKEGVKGELPDHLQPLVESGFLVSSSVNEDTRAQYLHQSLHRTDLMHLVIMPTEACNFRCTYCYQTFPRGVMKPSVREGIKQLVEQKGRFLQNLTISWFGGEPLLAFDVIEELSQSILQSANRYGFDYSAEMATNGFGLSLERFRSLLSWNVRRYMITLDGPEEMHDSRRFLTGGGKTFQQIIQNLKDIQSLEEDFEIYIRVNFDEDNLSGIPEFLAYLGELFAGDARFQTFCRPVGRWGGANDGDLPICDSRTAESKIWEFTEQGLTQGLSMSSMVESLLMPTGSVCYAAKPHSFVIGADGALYKCTCSFNEEFNHVGSISSDGSLEIDYDKLALWVTSGEEKDEVCRSCFYRPACQGNHCPLYRMRTGKRPCPYEKRKIKKVLNLIWKQYNQVGR
ncbi:MAG TPA: radical SAM protein [Bacillota bacterium]|nr:radical SAM protein [Bacillota bacterium]